MQIPFPVCLENRSLLTFCRGGKHVVALGQNGERRRVDGTWSHGVPYSRHYLCCFLCEDIGGLGDWAAKPGTQPGHHRRTLHLLPDSRGCLVCSHPAAGLWLSAKLLDPHGLVFLPFPSCSCSNYGCGDSPHPYFLLICLPNHHSLSPSLLAGGSFLL